MKPVLVIVTLIFAGVMSYLMMSLPPFGDPSAPANQHISPYYIENTIEDTDTPNIVTSILADYRGYDTFGETLVIFTAGLGCFLLLRRHSDGKTIR